MFSRPIVSDVIWQVSAVEEVVTGQVGRNRPVKARQSQFNKLQKT